MLERKFAKPPLCQKVADAVIDLCDQGLLLGEIAERLEIDRNTVTAAIRWWHKSRGLPVPDGRTRRKQLAKKTSKGRKKEAQPPTTPAADDVPRKRSA